MNILDTDALSHHMKRNAIGVAIEAQMVASPNPGFWITAVSAFEIVDGVAAHHKAMTKKRKDLITSFNLVQEAVEYLGSWRGRMHGYDTSADRIYRSFIPRLRQELGNDARISAIALSRGAAVWTCNIDDFKRVPGLIVYRAETGLRVT